MNGARLSHSLVTVAVGPAGRARSNRHEYFVFTSMAALGNSQADFDHVEGTDANRGITAERPRSRLPLSDRRSSAVAVRVFGIRLSVVCSEHLFVSDPCFMLKPTPPIQE
jgi:hypothetical protein